MRVIPYIRRLIAQLDDQLHRISHVRNSEFKDFIKTNEKFWNALKSFSIPETKKVIIAEYSACGISFSGIASSAMSSILGIAYEAKVLYLSPHCNTGSFANQNVAKSFSNCLFKSTYELTEAKGVQIRKKAREIFDKLKQPKDILALYYDGIRIGTSVYDSYLKYKHASVWQLDDRVCDLIEEAIRNIEAINRLKKEYEVVAGFSTHIIGSYCGILCRSLLQDEIPVYSNGSGLGALHCYNRISDPSGDLIYPLNIPKYLFNEIIERDETRLNCESEDYLKARFTCKVHDYDVMKAYAPDKQHYHDKKKFCQDYNLDPSKPIIFVMLHAMNDDPHHMILTMFDDYYDWFEQTLEFAIEKKDCNWVFKEHPSSKRYPNDANLCGIFKFSKRDNIAFISAEEKFNTASVKNLAKAVVTAAGTISLECASYGIPAVVCAKHFYSGYDIVYESGSKEQYFDYLRRIEQLEKLNVEKISKAKKLFYLLFGVMQKKYCEGFFPYHTWEEASRWKESELLEKFLENIRVNQSLIQKVGRMINFIRNIDKNKDRVLYLDYK